MMKMDFPICLSRLLSAQNFIRELPDEILIMLRNSSIAEYLDRISQLALNPQYTTTVFTSHEPVFVELCSRWLAAPDTNDLSVLAVLAKILPSAPHLSVYAKTLLERRRGLFDALASRRATALSDVPLEQLHILLLTLWRLLVFDNNQFASYVSPSQLQLLMTHEHRHIRYLALRILCSYIHASDAALTAMVAIYISKGEIAGQWEEKTIDYTFLVLWENWRLKQLDRQLQGIREASNAANGQDVPTEQVIPFQDLSRTTACVGGVLLPQLDGNGRATLSVIVTATMKANMRLLSEGVKSSKPLLLTGFSGAGKSFLVKEIATELGKSSSMITIHLNEQTDAKLLVGMYTSDKSPGSFNWRPGVLTTAVMEGRWVLIEDLDKAPKEILSTLLPLLERRELLIPTWGETIRAASDFKIIATVRSTLDAQDGAIIPTTKIIGIRHWLRIPLQTPSDDELAEIALKRYPVLQSYMPRFLDVYRTSRSFVSHVSDSSARITMTRPLGPQRFLTWCRRVQDLLSVAGISSAHEPISDATVDQIFLEAIDCFHGAIPLGTSRSRAADLIAQTLHISAERCQYCLHARTPEYHSTDSTLRIGRAILSKQKRARRDKYHPVFSHFALTKHVLRLLESVAVTVKQAEPCLLVGETGTGKTTIVQQLADALNHKLTVVNLSQQSEAGDLLGGVKPVNMRALAVPMKDEFDFLMELTFPSKRNQPYIDRLEESITHNRWARALKLCQEALRMFETHLKPGDSQASHSKKRKLQSRVSPTVRSRWDKFACQVQTFQKHLASGSKGFTFSFSESNIVRSARMGEWVLLDEINLASPDTLESLADLFSGTAEGGASILLTETGKTEVIRAHKDFRVFGAMNPATDIGKHDLPASLRSRFTELFIDAPDKDREDLISVVQVYLGDKHNNADVRAAHDIAQLYLEIKQLAEQNRLVDGANRKPHFSLRTLTRTLVYVLDIAPIYGLRRALFEGFSMGFLTVLNQESELLLQPRLDKHILSSHKNGRSVLRQTPRLPQDGRRYVQFKHYWVAQGEATIEEQPQYIITPFIERNLLNLVRATSTRRFPVLLQGPTSAGKTSMIEYLARISGNIFVRINNHEHTDLQEYLGTYTSDHSGRLQYQDGALVHALREGYWVVLDELNLAPTEVLEALNRLLDDNRELLIPETQEVMRPHPNFMLFATQNPPGVYGGRKALSRAFRNRFLELHFDDIPENELEIILRERSHIAPSFCARIVTVYKQLSVLRQSERLFEQKNSFATLRDLFRWALRDADDREQLAINGFFLLGERVRNQDERRAVKRVVEDVMKVKIDVDQVYGADKVQRFMGSNASSSMGIVWTKSIRRLFVLVTEAVKNNEPVLLVGETGSGKTTICQAIAELMNTELHIVNAHQNMETGDLIGSQRPIRNRTVLESQLATELVSVLRECGVYNMGSAADLPTLLEAYETLQRQSPVEVPHNMSMRIEQCKTRAKALFEWADGSLVGAMQKGAHFLLDEIALADDSVLERLNSVLEPGRTLFLAEKGPNNALVYASPGFQFLATMNPGGDYGKRELSPALRNRFTEIWVPHSLDESEMLQIAQAKLAPSMLEFAEDMVGFAAWYSVTYIPAAPYISIRDLLAWIQFVNTWQVADSALALLHGAAMVYIDGLGANPASRLTIAETEVSKERRACLLKLSEFFKRDMVSMYDEKLELSMTDKVLRVGHFIIPKHSEIATNLRYSLQAPTTITNAMKIIRALQTPKPILLEGNPGVGKTTLIAALAQTIGMPLTRINLSDQTDLMDLFGSDVPVEEAGPGQFGWRDAPFLRAMQNGEWVLLDEMNLASQSVLEGLNACLDHRGQVYISELNRTFQRHLNFVVFAAQNPHHQGGGRKGLPASFVNRFTVVYADTFTPDDLLFISNEMYPSVSRSAKETMLGYVSALSKLLQHDRRVGAQGGPWEINLRDVLRWLDLVTSQNGLMPFAAPEHYLNLLFLQRFRTAGDVTVISQSLRQYFPQHSLHSCFHGRMEGSVEIGMGLLPTNTFYKPAWRQPLQGTHLNLSIAESAMLCIQKNWPCLLVGASGSGKTYLIRKLANAVGANVVDLSLNSDMDTTDLVGGYEQLDPERQVANVIKRMQEHTQEIVIQTFRSRYKLDDNIAELEKELRAPVANLAEISRLIHLVARENTSLGFSQFLSDCESLMQQTAIDNRARFEWVDGILVKALKQGRWLILDNANLCSPSVLDRFNSLLEPDGFLSINEHREPDGSACTVKPHPGFRLFMTMDPRHGELSRAMRNRSIELFMPVNSPSSKLDVLGSGTESTVFRFEMFQGINWDSLDDAHFVETLAICFDHLTFQDLQICRRWQMQVDKGLHSLSSQKKAHVSFFVNLYQQMIEYDGKTLSGIQCTYETIGDKLGLLQSFGKMQTVNPFNNPILLSATTSNPPSRNLRCLGHSFELLLEIYRYGGMLALVAENAKSKLPAQMSPLEKSFASREVRGFQKDSTQPLAVFLQDMGVVLRQVIDDKGLGETEERQEVLPFAREVLFYLLDIYSFSSSHEFEDGVFQSYQVLGRTMSTRVLADGSSQSLTAKLAHALGQKLDTFNSSWQLCSGLGMEAIWMRFKPATASDQSQLDRSLQVRALADQFDALKWSSGAAAQELDSLRASFARMHDNVRTPCYKSFESLRDIRHALEELENRSRYYQTTTSPYLQSEFEMLCQYGACSTDEGSLERLSMIGLLSGRSTARLMEFGTCSSAWNKLSRLPRMAAVGQTPTELAAVRNVFTVSLLRKLEGFSEVTLQSLGLLRTEMEVMGKSMGILTQELSGAALPAVKHALHTLTEEVKEAIEFHLDSKESQNIQGPLLQLLHRLTGKTQHQNAASSMIDHLHQCISSAIEPSLLESVRSTNQRADQLSKICSVFVQFFTGCLLLYVPDRPFDPALRPMVERNRLHKRKAELEIKMRALRTFELAFTGQTLSFRSELVERSLQDLGGEPGITSVLRPVCSELTQLQLEFNNILKIIVLESPHGSILRRGFQGQSLQIQDVKLFRTNIAEAIDRFSNRFHAYEDITKPLVAMLQGLDIGLAFAILAGTQLTPEGNAIRYICETTPFHGARLSSFTQKMPDELMTLCTANFDPRLHFLESMVLLRGICTDLEISVTKSMFQAFHSLYEEWRLRLGHDQQENAAKSSLYRYRGSEHDSNDAEEQDFLELFPNYSTSDHTRFLTTSVISEPRSQARRLANLHRRIFQNTENPSQRLLRMIRANSRIIARIWQDGDASGMSPVPEENLLPAVTLGLDEYNEFLHSPPLPGNLYNFYTDANLSEAQKLVSLIRNIQAKFIDLQEAWPEHAILGDVLRTSSELMALRHVEPIAKLLTKAEQLHGFIHEWQAVASREYTASSLYNQLTDLLVSWRRLELSTWGRLLDMEDQKCDEDADSWWFLAYEIIIAAPLSIINNEEDIYSHAEGLFSTLADFLATTSIGQYNPRLRMIDCFKRYLELLVTEFPSMNTIHNVLVNFLKYYNHFEAPVRDLLRKQRHQLEMDVREILLLASWKDTNINALRDSAKRSHHKLFKVVRKYRNLLAQSSEIILAQGLPENVRLPQMSSQTTVSVKVPVVDQRALQTCRQYVTGWEKKPERFTNPTSTSTRMLEMSQLPSSAIDAASHLDSFGAELMESITILQKETPATLTKSNSEAIKHLKARKRKLYAETLRYLRQMGLRSNINADSFAKQASLSVVLTSSPPLADHLLLSDVQSAEYYFHRTLNIMSVVRERSRNHTEDLTHGEIARSVGYLESMISVMLRQRAVIATASIDLDRFDKTLSQMRKLWAPDLYSLKQERNARHETEVIRNTLRWLPGIIEAGSVIIDKHARLGGANSSRTIESLTLWKNRFTELLRVLDDLPELPANISSSQQKQTFGEAGAVLLAFKAELQQLIGQNPGLGFTLKQIELWTDLKKVNQEEYADTGQLLNLDDFDTDVSSSLDSILVAIQRVQEACTSAPTSDEDAAWLLRMDDVLTGRLKSLRSKEVNHLLEIILSNVQRLSGDDMLGLAAAICAVSMPILEQYMAIQQAALARHLDFHRSLCKLGSLLANSFSKIAMDGFCSPQEKHGAESQGTEKLESGTGLGEGEGAEDISKDVQDDEDLSELAQEGKRQDDREEIEDQKDAVNMDQDELEGETGEVSNNDGDDESGEEDQGDDLDEETGEIDGLDPTAVDEKLWNGKAQQTEKEKEGSKPEGEAKNHENEAATSTAHRDDDIEERNHDVESNQEDTEEFGDAEEATQETVEKMDPQVQEGLNLDLPEDIKLEGLDGTDAESKSSDGYGALDEMSDIDQDRGSEEPENPEAEDKQEDEHKEATQSHPDEEVNADKFARNSEDVESPLDAKPEDDGQEDDHRLLREKSDNAMVDADNVASSDVRGLGENVEQHDTEEMTSQSQAQGSEGMDGSSSNQQDPGVTAEDGQNGSTLDSSEKSQERADLPRDKDGSKAFKKLGDALEQWHRRQRQIETASEEQPETETRGADVDMADQDFEHLQDEEAEADTQALGAANNEQAQALGKDAMDLQLDDEHQNLSPNRAEENDVESLDEAMEDADTNMRESESQEVQPRPTTFIANNSDRTGGPDQSNTSAGQNEEADESHIEYLSTHTQHTTGLHSRPLEEARQLWSYYDSVTRHLSLSLTEQLRLILAPTLATKMRGDFRTGKRLNIKRIIPYIASQYKRDKIWMRRSVPSKRVYQIMLAVDDSKSMGESGSGHLAFETLVLVAKSLTMLEVGEICVVGFGNEVNVAHDFDKPFSSEAGAQVFQHFTFQQTGTNVRKLIADTINIFREARRKSLNAGTELWQLELIVSDGICEDHDAIRRLVRQAQEERIMIVFIIIDTLLKGQSIVNMSQAIFEPNGAGVSIKRYLESFPFLYYLVVGDVKELPGVLAQALRQWFSEVAETG